VQSLHKTPVDIAFICTKSYDTVWATQMISQYLAPDGFVVSLQNSINEERIAEVVGWGKVIGCIASTIGVISMA
jgi:2-dehydropantoate 2-reductase